mgnify:CR=1 FL=1
MNSTTNSNNRIKTLGMYTAAFAILLAVCVVMLYVSFNHHNTGGMYFYGIFAAVFMFLTFRIGNAWSTQELQRHRDVLEAALQEELKERNPHLQQAPRCGNLMQHVGSGFWQNNFAESMVTPVVVRVALGRTSQDYPELKDTNVEPLLKRVSHEVWSVNNPNVLLAVFSIEGNATGKVRGHLSALGRNTQHNEDMTLAELCKFVRGNAVVYG